MLSGYWSIGSTEAVVFDGAKNRVTGAWINDATGTFVLIGPDGQEIGYPIPMPYVSGTNGQYVGYIPASVTAAFTRGSAYTVAMELERNGVVLSARITRTARHTGPTQ